MFATFRLYTIIEKMVPNGRKVEFFARKNNLRNGWLSIGNQLGDTNLHDQELKQQWEDGSLLKTE